MKGFAELPEVVLGPLSGRPDAHWHHAPAGKWSPAQIVHHLAISVDWSSRKFEERRDRDPMTPRPRRPVEWLSRVVILGLRWMPTGFRAAQGTWPDSRPDTAAVERQFREGIGRFLVLETVLLPARGRDLVVRHPRMGDLTFEEWQRFHVLHCHHHARQIRERLPA